MKKKIWFCKKSFVVIEKCVSWKIQIQILFINDFEVIQDIIAKDIANNIKSLVNPKEIVTIVKSEYAVIIDIKRNREIINSSNSQ